MRVACLSAVFLLLACQADAFAADSSAPPQMAPSDAAMAEYRAKLEIIPARIKSTRKSPAPTGIR